MANTRTRIATFVPDARLVSILGEQLVSSPVVGLLELVKNAHDADATQVCIEALELRSRDNARFRIYDDGFGMSADDIQNRFLVPASSKKARQKATRQRSPGGRLPLGEKGIGRFATQAVGSRLELVTRRRGEAEVVLYIDWDRFTSGQSLADIELEIIERKPEVFVGEWHGTSLTITGLRQRWKQADLNELQKGLKRLKSPFPKFGLTAFDIVLSCPEYPRFQDLELPDLAQLSHYLFDAAVAADGTITYTYTCQHPSENVNAYTLHQTQPEALDLSEDPYWRDKEKSDSEDSKKITLKCGAFTFKLFVFDREAKYLRVVKADDGSHLTTQDLDAICGVSVFKDDVRVLPYGEPGNDWLNLDQSRINDPSKRIGNRNVVGFIELAQLENPLLVEKADREGLQENRAFKDLKRAILAGFECFAEHWRLDRPRPKDPQIRRRELAKDPRVTLSERDTTLPAPKRRRSEDQRRGQASAEELDPVIPELDWSCDVDADSSPGASGVRTQPLPSTADSGSDRDVEVVTVSVYPASLSVDQARYRGLQLMVSLASRLMADDVTTWAKGLGLVSGLDATAGRVDAIEEVKRMAGLLKTDWKSKGIQSQWLGDSFSTCLARADLCLATLGGLTFVADSLKRSSQPHILVVGRSFEREIRISGQGKLLPVGEQLMFARVLLEAGGGRLDQDVNCLVYRLPQG